MGFLRVGQGAKTAMDFQRKSMEFVGQRWKMMENGGKAMDNGGKAMDFCQLPPAGLPSLLPDTMQSGGSSPRDPDQLG